jgi:hypothetical protein
LVYTALTTDDDRLGLGSRYGLVRYWWVAIKLVLNLLLTGLVLVALAPEVADAAARARQLDTGVPAPLGVGDLIFPRSCPRPPCWWRCSWPSSSRGAESAVPGDRLPLAWDNPDPGHHDASESQLTSLGRVAQLASARRLQRQTRAVFLIPDESSAKNRTN